MRSFICLLGVILALTGCARPDSPPSAKVTAGEHIAFSYTCKTSDGALAATSVKAVAEDPGQTFSPLFAPLNNYLPACEPVPAPGENPPLHPRMGYEERLEKLIARQAAGAPLGIPRTISIDGEVVPGVQGDERYLQLNRIIRDERLQTMGVDQFESLFGAAPVIGIVYNSRVEPGISATVEKMEGDEVVIVKSAEPGTILPSHFGPRTVTQTHDTLEYRTIAAVGDITRTSGLTGRVSRVDDETIEIDYGHSSAFLPLTCEVEFSPCSSPDGLEWTQDPDRAREQMAQSGKPLLIHFHDHWSSPCRELYNTVLPDPEVIDALEGFVRLRVNTINRPDLTKLHRVSTVPSILIYDNQGNLKSTVTNLPKAKKLVEELRKVQAAIGEGV